LLEVTSVSGDDRPKGLPGSMMRDEDSSDDELDEVWSTDSGVGDVCSDGERDAGDGTGQ
jgi:hypothetical protein